VARFTAIFDANVLFSMTITDIALEAAQADFFRPRWSADIHDEWIRNLLKKNDKHDRARIDYRRKTMDSAFPDALVAGYEDLVHVLDLPDQDDRHVLAAAIVGNADVIVTKNVKHFPDSKLAPFAIEVQHPDTFLIHQRGLNPAKFLECVRRCRSRLKNPPKTADEYLDGLKRAELVVLASELAQDKEPIVSGPFPTT